MGFANRRRPALSQDRRVQYGIEPAARTRPGMRRIPRVRKASVPSFSVGRYIPNVSLPREANWPVLLAAGALFLGVLIFAASRLVGGGGGGTTSTGSGPRAEAPAVVSSPTPAATAAPTDAPAVEPDETDALQDDPTDPPDEPGGEPTRAPRPAPDVGDGALAYVDTSGNLVLIGDDGDQSVASGAQHPGVSPDGGQVAYVRHDGVRSELWLWDGEDERLLGSRDGYIRNVVWEEGDALLYHVQENGHSSTRIRRYDLESGEAETVLASDQLELADASIQGFDGFPDGRLAVQVSIAPDGYQYANGCGIYVINPDDADARALVALREGACFGLPSVSPDGERVAFISYPGDGNGYVAVIGADGEGYRELAAVQLRGTADNPFWPRIAWSPDSETVVYETVDGGDALYAQGIDESAEERRLVGYGRHPAWR